MEVMLKRMNIIQVHICLIVIIICENKYLKESDTFKKFNKINFKNLNYDDFPSL